MTLESMMEEHGYYVEVVGGQERYVTTDEHDRAVVAPVKRHAPGRGWWRGRRHTRNRPQADTEATVLLPSGEEVAAAVGRASVRSKWLGRVYDREWHEAVRNSAVDVAVVALAFGTVVAVLKGALFLVML